MDIYDSVGSRAAARDREIINEELSKLLVTDRPQFCGIIEAMRYSGLGGKRLRGVMTLAFARAFGADENCALRMACAVECVQAYSLVHDDLPCMDDDDLRRGKPSCHKQFDEATAVLTGDALLTYAFELAAGTAVYGAQNAADAILALAGYAGFKGMVGGQMLDLAAAGKVITPLELTNMHKLKAAALFRAAAAMGCCAAGAGDAECDNADAFAEAFGLAFQIVDDLCDAAEGNETELNSCVAVNGAEKSAAKAREYIRKAEGALIKLENMGYDVQELEAVLKMITDKLD